MHAQVVVFTLSPHGLPPFREDHGQGEPTEASYDRCIRIQPALLVMLSPLTAGYDLGKFGTAATLVGGIISAAQMAISTSNTGGARGNTKKKSEKRELKGHEHYATQYAHARVKSGLHVTASFVFAFMS